MEVKDKRKTENDVNGLDNELGLQQVKEESRTTGRMVPLDVQTYQGRKRNKEEDPLIQICCPHSTSVLGVPLSSSVL